ncbi:hypothetical protein RF11_00492 [Thelohanellus kitauei]|uniref:Uncharacterized protein n=1 Tax=Thelohanellus kitauei TaxID=669202 RepID=A0A0C2N3Z8_THEKT|nr:hypothetical protein RF11_00492 [Thelohanellus kitauei]
MNWQQGQLLSKSLFSSRSTTRGYIAAFDLCLQDIKDQCRHPRASEKSIRVSKYPAGKHAFKIRSGACGSAWFAKASGPFTLAAMQGTLWKTLLSGDFPSHG